MSKVVSRDGTAIAYDRTGDGPALILVDGATAYRAINPAAAEIASLLAPHFTVYAYDRRGRGESGDTPPYEVVREVEDLAALIAEAGGSAFVCGGSSGAVLGLHAAAHGVPITKLAMYEPPFIVDDSRPPLPADYVARLNELVSAGRRGDAVELFMTAAVGMPAEFVTPMRAEPFWAAVEQVAHTIAYDGTIMGETMSGTPAPLRQFASVTVPTLVIDGGASDAFMHNGADALAEVLPHAERRTLEGQDHAVAGAVLAPVLRDFLSG
jgi:pimeloyl-ACP methyl ester carboxylesterase